jgi:hypothetical protein
MRSDSGPTPRLPVLQAPALAVTARAATGTAS